MLYEMLVGNMKGGQTYWKHKKTESESESFLCIFVMPPCISAILLSGFKICILLPSQTSFSNEKPFSQIPLSTWEDIVHLRTEQMPLKNIQKYPKVFQGFPRCCKIFPSIPGHSKIFQKSSTWAEWCSLAWNTFQRRAGLGHQLQSTQELKILI